MMQKSILSKYAQLLVNYCLEIKAGDRLFIQTTTLAEDLVREVYREALKAGASIVEVQLEFREQNSIFLGEGTMEAMKNTPIVYSYAMENFEGYLYIKAPFNLRDDFTPDPEKAKLNIEAMAVPRNFYFERTADRRLKRNLCLFPTIAGAQEAGMSLESFENFVYKACKLDTPDPIAAWQAVHNEQQHIVDYLNKCQNIRYLNSNFDIKFNTLGRTWINSDGHTNMPSGEVYTSPVENSVNGTVFFDYPGIHNGNEVEGVMFTVENGVITQWSAQKGEDYIHQVMQIPGARVFGEAAIGTNYQIDRLIKNILFDEKIGGTIHFAIGQSYQQCGGKNTSPIHWDLLAGMKNGGRIYADGNLIYEDGLFII
jgi:aminopeptidase